ncbi:Nuclear pore complex protein Nup98-Nup96 [Nosema bombycis CQ1]|uniref:Nuclear pore complex protein Nup98-Nup96 n=1 Tax=Nosema bombycis (strain CQ1 / CVCC 102059) TaxID=578461 RepID=R0MCC4_NOSB1|nr:Nuclear pore complex protein Nup98-Nup96 [Nosema bombycis CQ1]|eukprot:EOB11700.1 Nuclear pore complex protein Nup98-Nup96 [Nosema bombycis CQ1]
MNQNNNLSNIFKSGMFNNTPQKENTPSPFGSTNQNQNPFASSNIFQGGSNPLGGSNSLGGNNPLGGSNPLGTQNTTTPSFGQSSYFMPPKPQGSVFGSSTGVQSLPAPQSNTFGTPASSWGTTQTFGSTPTPTNTFGTSTAFGSTSAFGNTPTTTAFGSTPSTSFGSTPSTTFGSTPTSTFGSTPTSTFGTTPTSTFGSKPTMSFGSTPFSSGFQSNALSLGTLKNGTRDTPYQDTRVKDGIGTIEIKHINAMNEYARKSNDELRQEDYNLGRKAITSGGMGGITGTISGLGSTGGLVSTTGLGSTGAITGGLGNTGAITGLGTTSTNLGTANLSTSPFDSNRNIPGLGSSNLNSFSFNKLPSTQPPVTQQQSVFGSTPSTFQTGSSIFGSQPTTPTPSPFGTQPSTNPFGTPSTVPPTVLTPPSTTPSPFGTTPLNTQQPFAGSSLTSTPFTTSLQPVIPNMTTIPNMSTIHNMSTISNLTSPTIINNEDPFLLQDIKFEKVEKKKILPLNRVIPKPIFSDLIKKPLINLQYRPPKINHKKKIYTEPSVEEARHLKEIENLVIGFDGKGRIQYIDKVLGSEVTTTNIEDKISFMKNEILVSDPPGVGLNKRARVYVEGVYAFSKSQGDYIIGKAEKHPLKAIQERFVYELKEDPYKKFIDYNYDTGLYVYDVNHF